MGDTLLVNLFEALLRTFFEQPVLALFGSRQIKSSTYLVNGYLIIELDVKT